MLVALHNRTQFSIQSAFSHIDDLVDRALELGIEALAITDKHTLSGCVEFYKTVKEKSKGKIKPILGCDLYISETEYITVLCQNRTGWDNLIKLVNKTDWTQKQPYINASEIKDEMLKDLIIITQIGGDKVGNHNSVGGYNLNDMKYSLYPNPDDRLYLQIILASKHKCTSNELLEKFPEYKEIFDGDSQHHLIGNSGQDYDQIVASISDYDISNKPKIPTSGIDKPDEYLMQLCRDGWKDKLLNKLKDDSKLKEVYTNRIKTELEVIKQAKLANYFLVIREIMHHSRSSGYPCGLRGSASGCLISYLIDISDIDPILPDPTLPYDPNKELSFQRFYSDARNTDNNISLPDIDGDFPISFREELIEFIKDKYGHDCVSNIITFGRMDGRGAIKEVFRVLNPVPNSFEMANVITDHMVDTAKVQDELEELKEDNPKYNVINYCIDTIPIVKEYYDQFKNEFDIAIRLANTIRNEGKHAAGIVISPDPLDNWFPCKTDPKTNQKVLALEMEDAEYVGAVKYDILGVAAYEKIYKIIDMINNNLLEPVVGLTEGIVNDDT